MSTNVAVQRWWERDLAYDFLRWGKRPEPCRARARYRWLAWRYDWPAFRELNARGELSAARWLWSLVEAPKPFFYLPLAQNPRSTVTFLVRSRETPEALAGLVRRELREIDAGLPAFAVQTLDEYVARKLQQPRMLATLLGACGVVALLLASFGLYGVLSYVVGLRSREIGIRMALGAARGDVIRLVVGQGMARVLAGIAIGLVAATGCAELVSGMLFGVRALDPATFAAASAVMATVAALACFVPARRATRVDPAETLRRDG